MGTTKALIYDYLMSHDLYDEYESFAAYMFFEHRMSFFNSALITMQRPGALCVMTEYAWQRDYGRIIKPGALPIVIMCRNGPVSFVYDISDTVGKRAPRKYRDILREHEKMTPIGDLYEDLMRAVRKDRIHYTEKPLGLLMHGEAAYSTVPLTVEDDGNEYRTHYSITINSSDTSTYKAAAIIHELAHICCGHCTDNDIDDKEDRRRRKIPARETEMVDESTGRHSTLDRNTMEYEAEKTVELVCRIMGFEYRADDYLSGYDTSGVDTMLSQPFINQAAESILEKLRKAKIRPSPVIDTENGFDRFCG